MGETKTFLGSIVSAKYSRLIGVSALAVLFVISALVLAPVCKTQDDTFAAPVPSETTLVMTTPSVTLGLTVNNVNGTFASDSSDFSVTSNNYTGYTLSIRAKENSADSSKLVNGNNVLNSIESATADGAGFNIGNWGYKPSKLNSANNTNYLPAPTYSGSTLDVTNAANNTANTYSLAVAAKADYTVADGIYSNTFVLTAVGNPVNYTISYNKNTTDTVGNMPVAVTGEISDEDIYISSNTPSRTGYTFKGWCSGDTTTVSGVDSCSYQVYSPGDLYAMNMQVENTLVLKAIWERNIYTISYDLADLNNLNSWDQNYPTRDTITYAGKVSNVQIVGRGGGWEIIYMPVAVKQNVEYELSFTAKGTNITPLRAPYNGVGVQILNTTPSNSDCLSISIATAYIEPNFNGTKTIKFTPATNTVYLAINMGMLADDTYGQYDIGNFVLTEKIGYGQTLAKIPTLTPKNSTFNGYYTSVSGGNAVSNSTPVPAANTTYFARSTINNYTLTVTPNGGSYNGKTANTTVTKNYTSTQSYGFSTPTRSSYTFNGWSLSGSGLLVRGNAAGTGSAFVSPFTQTVKTDSDGSQYTNYKYTNYSTSSTTWPNIGYPAYSYTSGHTYRITFDVRVNTYSNLAYLMFRHSAFGNDWGSTAGYAAVYVDSSDVGKGWQTFTMYRTFTGTTIDRGGTAISISPRFEIYTGINAGNTASVDFDIRNITIQDANTETYLTPSGFTGWVYKFGMGNGTATANWTR